eukprot:4323815-Amphidinium_carterae.3
MDSHQVATASAPHEAIELAGGVSLRVGGDSIAGATAHGVFVKEASVAAGPLLVGEPSLASYPSLQGALSATRYSADLDGCTDQACPCCMLRKHDHVLGPGDGSARSRWGGGVARCPTGCAVTMCQPVIVANSCRLCVR